MSIKISKRVISLKVSNFTFHLTPMDLLTLVKKFIDPENKIKKVEADAKGIYIFLPTPLSFDIKLRMELSCLSGYYLCIEMHIDNLGLIPDKIKDKAIEKFFPPIEAKGIKQNKNEIFIDLRHFFDESGIKMEIEDIETSKDGIKITGTNLSYPLPGLGGSGKY